jgi:drug/metabolite transporter (DMT)-like permease
MTTDRKRGYLYILLAAMLYSTTEVALKALGGAFAPMQVTVERVLLGAAALMPFALNDLKKRDIQLTKADWGYFTLLGFLTVTLHMSLLQMAVLHMDASATSIIYSGNPVFAVALAHFILHEPLKKNHLLAIGVELVGILFILNPAHLEISLRGFLEIITATLLFATYGTLCKLRLPRLGALVITTFNMLIGGLELLFLLLLGEIPAVGALYSGLGLEIFAGIPFSRALRSKRRCFCAMSASAVRPSAFCSRRRSRSTPLRRRRRSFISSSPFWQRRWRSSCTTSISA